MLVLPFLRECVELLAVQLLYQDPRRVVLLSIESFYKAWRAR
jgi:hypothetical protein